MSDTLRRPLTHLFLDLEDTIITPAIGGFAKTQLINVEKIQNFIQLTQPDTLNIFSFAIYDDTCLANFFNTYTDKMIEKSLGMNLINIPTVQNMIDIFTHHMRIGIGTVDISDFFQMVGKQTAFRHFVKRKSSNNLNDTFILVDDVVEWEEFQFPGAKGIVRNVDNDL